MDIDNQQLEFKDLDLGDMYFSTGVSLDLLTQTVPAFAPLALLDGLSGPFPAVSNLPAGNFPIADITEFEYVVVDSASMELKAVNNFPIKTSIIVDLYNKLNLLDTIASFDFPDIPPGDSASSKIIIRNISISNSLQVSIRELSTPGSLDAPVNLNDEISLNFTFEDIAFSEGKVKLPEISFDEISDEHHFDIQGLGSENVKIHDITMESGTIDIQVNSDIAISGTMELELTSATIDGNPAVFQIDLDASQQAFTEQIDISDLDIDMTTGTTFDSNTIPYRVSVSLDSTIGFVQIFPTAVIDVNIALNGATPSYIAGDFGYQVVDIDQGEIEMEIELWDRIDGGFGLLNPQLTLFISNSVGIPLQLNAQFTAYNNQGKSEDLNPAIMDVGYPELPSDGTVNSTITYDNSNSDIVDFIALPPGDMIEYSGTVEFNPSGSVDPAKPNFITNESEVTIGVEANLPIELQTDLLSIKDTMPMDPSEINGVDSLVLMLFTTNGIPLDISLGLTLVDTITGTPLGKQFGTGTILAAEADAEGNVTAPTISSTEIVLAAEDFENFESATGMAIEAKLNSPEAGTKPAKLFANSEFSISIGIRTIISPLDLMESSNEED
jgi:hypothetical protein